MREAFRGVLTALRDDVPWRSVAIVAGLMVAVFVIGIAVVYTVNAFTVAVDRPLAPYPQPPPMPSNMPGMDGY